MLIFTTTPISCLFFALIKRSYVHKTRVATTSKRGWITNCEFYISAILFLLPPLRSFFYSNNTLLLWEGSYKEMFRHASVLHYFQMLFNLRYNWNEKSYSFLPTSQWLYLQIAAAAVTTFDTFVWTSWEYVAFCPKQLTKKIAKVLFLFSRWISQTASVGYFSSVKDEFKN